MHTLVGGGEDPLLAWSALAEAGLPPVEETSAIRHHLAKVLIFSIIPREAQEKDMGTIDGIFSSVRSSLSCAIIGPNDKILTSSGVSDFYSASM